MAVPEMDEPEELLDLVDENDKVVAVITRAEVGELLHGRPGCVRAVAG